MKPLFIKLFSLPAAGVCFLREAPERAIGSDRRTGKWGLTLTAMANVLQNYPQEVVTKEDYLKHLQIYSNSHRLKLPAKDGKPAQTICWIDENLHPQTGEWLARALLKEKAKTSKDPGKLIKERGQHYNHSIFCDLIIIGLCAACSPAPTHASSSARWCPTTPGPSLNSRTSPTTEKPSPFNGTRTVRSMAKAKAFR